MRQFVVCHLTNGRDLDFGGLCNHISEDEMKQTILFNRVQRSEDPEKKDVVIFLGCVPVDNILWIENIFQEEKAQEDTNETA